MTKTATKAVSPGSLLHRHRPRSVLRAGDVQEDRGRYPARTARLRKRRATSRIYTAGEKEHDVWLERKGQAGVPVGVWVQKEFIAIRDKKNLPYKFPLEQ
ncbi:MAG: hypothetical protein R2912_09485 [Eubacteriales bacterium]